ncbi:MAG TPA: TolC family protein [Terracidiphilus sp.]|nr:TolC family protein [Terracidiphilus sp.]
MRDYFSLRQVRTLVFASVAALAASGSVARAQAPNPSSATDPFWGSITLKPATDEVLKLSLDEAVRRGFQYNLGLKEAESGELALQGQKNQALQQFLPTVTFTGGTGYYQHNLVAQGFKPSLLSKFKGLFPAGQAPAGFSTLTRDDLTTAQIHFSQTLFSGPVIAGYKAAGAATRAAYFAKMTARGQVVQDVATTYLRCIADASQVENAKAQVNQAQVLYDHEHQAHEAGTAANLDELRAQVQLQTQQQAVIAAQNQLDKDLILLKREIGVDPGQKMELTDPAPYSELAAQTPEEALATAYKDRQDYQNLQNQAVEFKAIHAAYRSQRLPTLKFTSFYGTSTVNGAGTHGNFVAFGTLNVPIFREARLRGDEDASLAQLQSVNDQLADLRTHMDQQVRSALLDVAANQKLVDVARSNVDLATRALSDETDRVNAGVDDNLPLVTAQAALAAAQSNLIESLYQYNVSKVLLARACGVLEQQYRVYLGK